MQTFAGFPGQGASNDHEVIENVDFQDFPVLQNPERVKMHILRAKVEKFSTEGGQLLPRSHPGGEETDFVSDAKLSWCFFCPT